MPLFFSFRIQTLKFSGTTTWFIIEHFIDVIYCVDILINFRTTFHDKSTGDEITKPILIAKKYIQSGFPLDFVATLSVVPSIFSIEG